MEAPPKPKKAKSQKNEERHLRHIDWAALGVVTVVSIVTSVIFTILMVSGIRLVSATKIKSNEGGSGAPVLPLGYVLLGLAGLLVLFGIYRLFRSSTSVH